MKIVFMGTPEMAVLPLEYLDNMLDIDVVAVVTQPDRPAGRGYEITPPPVKVFAESEERNIKVFQTESISKDAELIETLRGLDVDYFVTVAFGQILSQEVLDIPKIGTINLHASLLPEYRGANPIQRAIVEGKKMTGITTMLTALELDAGDILLTKKIKITDNMTTSELTQIISQKAGELISDSLFGYEKNIITPRIQDNSKATYAHKFKKEDGLLTFKATAKEIHNKVRGLPSVVVPYGNEHMKIIKTKILDEISEGKIGEVLKITPEGIAVGVGKGIILIEELQLPGKKAMKAYAWANGANIQPYDVLK